MAEDVQGQAAEAPEPSGVSAAQIAVHWREEETYPPPASFAEQANAADLAILERFTEEVAARMPTPDEARTLSLPPGVPVFRLIRTAYDRDGRAVEVCDTIMAADAYLLAYDLPAH